MIGSGLGRRLAEVRWALAGRMAIARAVTLPAAALAAGAAGLHVASRRAAVNHENVNDAWPGDQVETKIAAG